MIVHLALLVANDILLIAMKKAHDRFINSECRSSCCDGITQAACCLRYVNKNRPKRTR